MTTWLSRSRTKERITRGENWLLASCRLTTVSENTTPAVVIMAPATVLSSQVAVLLLMCSVPGRATSAPMARSRALLSSARRSEEHTSELQSRQYLVCRLLLEKQKHNIYGRIT